MLQESDIYAYLFMPDINAGNCTLDKITLRMVSFWSVGTKLVYVSWRLILQITNIILNINSEKGKYRFFIHVLSAIQCTGTLMNIVLN